MPIALLVFTQLCVRAGRQELSFPFSEMRRRTRRVAVTLAKLESEQETVLMRVLMAQGP